MVNEPDIFKTAITKTQAIDLAEKLAAMPLYDATEDLEDEEE